MNDEIFKKTNKLKSLGIKYLMSCFISPRDRKLIKEKFSNISGKTGQYFVPKKLWQKRTARKNRALIPFEHVLRSNLTYEQLDTFEGGIVVEFVNNDYFDQLRLPECQQNLVFKRIKNRLGSNDNVSGIINIRSVGDSSSHVQRMALDSLEEFLNNSNQRIEEVLIKRDSGVNYEGQGNDKWRGYVYYSVKGGQQNARDSHDEYGIPSREVQLFNPSVEYAGSIVSNDITLVLIYFAMFSVPEDKRSDDWENLIAQYLEYFSVRKYNNKTLKDYVINHISLKLEDGRLFDPIQVRPIQVEDFIINNRSENSLDITHQTSVNRYSYIWDEELGILLTAARPTNLFWSKHLSNMMQQDFSLKEYFVHQRGIIAKWDEYGIDNLDE